MDEFSIIRQFFARQAVQRDDVVTGIGDDAAVLITQPDLNLVCTTDMLLEGVHFPELTDPYAVGYKALAVNLSDLAAMGAQPAWVTLLVSLPVADLNWIKAFSAGFLELAADYGVQLIGGDVSRGALMVGVQAMGYTRRNQALLRSGAVAGDDIYVSGQLGDASMALKAVQGHITLSEQERARVVRHLEYPQPRVNLGHSIVGITHAAIDISDGLYADLGHIAASSAVAARINLDLIPISSDYRQHIEELGWETVLCGGDDYELCFTALPQHSEQVAAIARRVDVPVTKIGHIENGRGVSALTSDGAEFVPQQEGYDHFAA